MIDAGLLARVDELQLAYVNALDTRDLPAWAECFAPTTRYACLSRENEEQDLPLPLMLDDNLDRIHDRVKTIASVWTGTVEDYTTRHFVQRLRCTQPETDLLRVETNFLVAYTNRRGQSEVLATGVYRDEIVLGDELKFRSKTAVVDTITMPRYLVYPL